MDDELEADSTASWVRFRARLADALDDLVDGDILAIHVIAGINAAQLHGSLLSLDLLADGDLMRAQVCSNHFLDERFALDEGQMTALEAKGWAYPADETDHFQLQAARHEVDRVAVLAVQVLRDVLRVPHPVFLDAEGLERDPEWTEPEDSTPSLTREEVAGEDDEELIYFPTSRDELIEQAEPVFASILDAEVEYDDDGDVPLPVGESVVYARFGQAGPTIELFSYLVVDIVHTDRVAVQLEMLNGTHPFAAFTLEGKRVVMRHNLCATPFVPMQLRIVLRSMLSMVDELAGELAGRVGGRRYLAEAPRPVTRMLPMARVHHGLVALLELLRLRPVSTATVTTLFDDDRPELVRQIVLVSDGRIDCGDVDREVVLDHLRRALHRVVGAEVARRRAGKRQPRTQQVSLLSVTEETLDQGDWDTETA